MVEKTHNMKILGNRVLVSRIEDETKEGFTTVDIQDSFIYKGRVEQIGGETGTVWTGTNMGSPYLEVGKIVYFAKYSPHTQDLEGMKVIRMEDIIAVE
jgi:co-chaperonin GroES (HSP10)